MADDFTAEDLLEAAKERFGEDKLRLRMRGSLTDESAADDELLEIAEGVYSRARAAASASVGWPLPGQDDDGIAYREKWPGDFFQRALDLFNYRAYSDFEAISDNERIRGRDAEKYFDDLEKGIIGLGIGGETDVAVALPLAARARDGSALISGLLDPTMPSLLDRFRGPGWDTY